MRVVFACGGTAGHIYPALAMADILKKNTPKAEILFVGAEKGMENQLVKNAGYDIFDLEIEGLKRRLTFENFKVLYLLSRALVSARKWLINIKPDIVIGTGGYVCYPVLRMACSLGIPTAVHESNAIPGLAVKMLARHVDRIWLGSAAAVSYIKQKDKTAVCGNPLRSSFDQSLYAKANARQKYGIRQNEFFVLSFGGSLGAKPLNDCMFDILCKNSEQGIRYCHICGQRYAHIYPPKKIPKQHLWLPFTEDMPTLMQAADLVICRAGAMTLAEVSACKKVSILIPSPNVAKNHQYYNAKALADKNAAIMLREEQLSAESLFAIILHLHHHPEIALEMKKSIQNHFQYDTPNIILDECESLLQQEE